MKIENLKELEKLLKLCRKQGVTELMVDGHSFKLGELPRASSEAVADETSEDPYAEFPEEMLSPEELAYFASGGLPQDNPYRKTA